MYISLGLFVHGSWIILHGWGTRFRAEIGGIAGTWVLACLIGIAVGLPVLLVKGSRRVWRRVTNRTLNSLAQVDEGRRQFLGNVALPAVALSLGGGGALGGAANFVVTRRQIRVRNWPKALDGFRIGQITDTHVGDFIGPDTVARAVEVLNTAQVHLQVMTGDLVNSLKYIEPTFDALERCRAPYGMLAVLGNHEKMHHRLGPMLDAYARRRGQGPIRLLVDEHAVIRHNGALLRVVGVDYPMHENGNHFLRRPERLALMQESAKVAFAQVLTSEHTLICLSHHPEFFPLAAERNVSLTLSGHTHGGQVAIGGKPVFSTYAYMLGHYQLADSHLYVSGGTGHWLPIRYGVPTEVTVLTLRSI